MEKRIVEKMKVESEKGLLIILWAFLDNLGLIHNASKREELEPRLFTGALWFSSGPPQVVQWVVHRGPPPRKLIRPDTGAPAAQFLLSNWDRIGSVLPSSCRHIGQ